MAWLQNLAGRAEDLLNKIDQNAATVLNDSVTKPKGIESQVDLKPEIIANLDSEGDLRISINTSCDIENSSLSSERLIENEKLLEETNIMVDKNVNFEVISEKQVSLTGNETEDHVDKLVICDRISPETSSNSLILAEEVSVLEETIDKLTKENQHLNEQLLNIQHQYSQLSNEANNLRFQVESINKQLVEAQMEKDIYIARAQRILQEKERNITLQQGLPGENTDNLYASYNEQLRKDLYLQRQQFEEELKKNSILKNDIDSLQLQHQAIQNEFQATIQSLQRELENERRLRNFSDEDYKEKNKVIFMKEQESAYLTKCLEQKNEEINKLMGQLNATIAEDVDEKIKSLTHTLMMKQQNLETVTTERNALKFQLERIQSKYQRVISRTNGSQERTVLIEERDDSLPMPSFMRVSPFDAGVTRRVKKAYSTLDAVSIRTGIFLRRYPVARVFIFCYMVLLHIWVLIILFLYAPSNR